MGTPPPLSLLCSAVASKLCLQESQSSLASETGAAPPQASPSTASSSDANESTLNETSFRERLARSDLPPDAAAAAAASTETASSAVSDSVSPTSELHVEAVGHASTSSTIAGGKSGEAEAEAVMVGEVLPASPGSKSSSGSEHSEGSGQRASVSASFSVLDSSSNGGVEPPEPELESPVPEASDLEWPGDEPSSDTNGGNGGTNGGPKRPKGTTPPAGAPADASAAPSSSPRAKPETANATHSNPPLNVQYRQYVHSKFLCNHLCTNTIQVYNTYKDTIFRFNIICTRTVHTEYYYTHAILFECMLYSYALILHTGFVNWRVGELGAVRPPIMI